jgi:glyoxylase-like metal-dependent hydrolase (beta-lactamase superfamily II)
MLFRELNRGNCKTYLVGCEGTRRAALIDPVRERVDRYLAFLAYHGYQLELAIDTHTHADHRTGTWDLRDLTGARTVMHERAPAPNIDVHVEDGERLPLGGLELLVMSTPGHSADGMSLYLGDRVFTGDSSTGPAGPTSWAAIPPRSTTASTRSCSRFPTRPSSFPGTTTGGTPTRRSARRSGRIHVSPGARARNTCA